MNATATLPYSEILASLLSSKWQLIGETSAGAQLKHPRVMRGSTKAILAVGIVGLVAAGLGLLFIALGLVDFYLMTKERTYFLSRENPALPPAEEPAKGMSKVMIALLVVLVLAVIGLALQK